MRRLGSLSLLLAVLFIFAQQAAILHALSHDSRTQTQQDKHLPGGKVCEKCIVFAQFSAAVAALGAHVPLCAGVQDFLFQSDTGIRQQPAVAYLSRAPPVLS